MASRVGQFLSRTLPTWLVPCFLLGVLAVASPAVRAADGITPPQFASLKADEVNLRVGPGKRYPIAWVYQRRGLPVEVTAAFEQWRRVSDHEGTRGWIHERLLSPRRTALVMGKTGLVREKPDADAQPLARLEPGVIVELLTCTGAWCRVTVADYEGWIEGRALWGAGLDGPAE